MIEYGYGDYVAYDPGYREPEIGRVTRARRQTFPGESIVRCKECVWGKAVEQIGCIRFEDRGSDGLKDPDGFCSWGEKRED